tara:strand:+ start:1642 stop:1830 length:189 start_codon:yes stop_codon:yes gene_type:complete
MTYENRVKRYKHYMNIVNGNIPAPRGHKHWNQVKANAKTSMDELISKYPDVKGKIEKVKKSK